MTTAVFDGKTLATDTQITTTRDIDDRCIHCNGSAVETIADVDKLTYYVGSGTMFKGSAVIAVVEAGSSRTSNGLKNLLEKNNLDKETFENVRHFLPEDLNLSDGRIGVWTEQTFWEVGVEDNEINFKEIIQFPWEIGCGGMAALVGLKHMNLNPIEAVALAVDIDPYTGGEVHSVTFEEGVGYVLKKTPLDQITFIKGKQ